MCFINLPKAYGSVDRELLWEVLTRAGVPDGMIMAVGQFHTSNLERVCMDNGVFLDWFAVPKQLR